MIVCPTTQSSPAKTRPLVWDRWGLPCGVISANCVRTGVVSADEVFTIIEGENLALFLDNLDEGQYGILVQVKSVLCLP